MSFRYLTAGESHGKALIGILEGMPSGLSISKEYIYQNLKRRKLGYGRGFRQKIETDEVEIMSGIRLGKTLGSPICLMIQNRDWEAWKQIMQIEEPCENQSYHPKKEVDVPRPGHADLVGGLKYQHQDMRNVLERSSARETAIRVAIGAVAIKFLEELGIRLGSRVIRIGEKVDSQEYQGPVENLNPLADSSSVRVLSKSSESLMIEEINRAQEQGDTLGGEFEIIASGLPVGLGSYVQWDRRLEGKIAHAMMSLNAIKGVEIGLGFKAASLLGSQVHDVFAPASHSDYHGKRIRFESNRSGGIDGGMSTGQKVIIRAAMKPLSTLMKPLSSVNLKSWKSESAHIERSDVCAVPSAAVIGEYLLGLVIAQEIMEKFGGDSMREILRRVRDWNYESII